jgi:NADPH:quinone reductase-like Zn-dependent oxidoreductase
VLKLESDYPKPTPTGDKILVKVHAASLNPFVFLFFLSSQLVLTPFAFSLPLVHS